ncbi:hypothetical protein LIER_14899 [Lithospermum erythrorhizon]|uniref:Uncharacterized protein n=1 Tax=Lithospermum erythrorhizon TaxID=34254 RepID=A0AAV3Q369_LITER
MAAHPYCRRVSKEQLLENEATTKVGIPPKQVISSLRKNHPGLLSTSRTVYNAKAKLKKEWLSGRNILEALFDRVWKMGVYL